MSCEHCLKGVRHEDTPTGTFETIANVKCYVSTPSSAYDESKVVIYFTDAHGLELQNNLLLADDFARNGYKVIAPDLFEGEPVDTATLDDPESRASFDYVAWLSRHTPAHNLPRVRAVLDALRTELGQAVRMGATGYCYGGRLVFELACADAIDAAATLHPSLIEDRDWERYALRAKAPVFVNACEFDDWFGATSQDKARSVLKGFKPGFEMAFFEGCTHGFAVRGDLSDPVVRAGKEGALKNTVRWFKRYL